MNQQPPNPFQSPEILKRLLHTFICLSAYIVGRNIPMPGLHPDYLAAVLGGEVEAALRSVSIFALGIWPYVGAAVVVSVIRASGAFDSLAGRDAEGRNAIYKSTRFVAAAFALAHAALVALGTERMPAMNGVETTLAEGAMFMAPAVAALAAGAMLALWLAEEITENGVGSGVLLLLFIEVAARLPGGVSKLNALLKAEEVSSWYAAGIVLMIAAVVFASVLVETAQRTTTVQYAKRVVGRMLMGGNQTSVPAKTNPAGASALIAAAAVGACATAVFHDFTAFWYLRFPLIAALVVYFSWTYRKTLVDPRELARQIQSSGGFIPGIRADGIAGHLSGILDRLSIGSGLIVAAIALVPPLVSRLTGYTLMFDELALFLAAAATFDLMGQVQSRYMVQNFGGSLPQPGGKPRIGGARHRPSKRRKKRR